MATFPHALQTSPFSTFPLVSNITKQAQQKKKTEMTSQDDHLVFFSDCVVCAFGIRKWKSGKPEILCAMRFTIVLLMSVCEERICSALGILCLLLFGIS
jgi:hypothetical protein